MKCLQKVAMALMSMALIAMVSGMTCLASEGRTLIWEDGYANTDTEDATAPQPFDQAYDHGALSVYANSNELFERSTLTMIAAPATKGYVTYDVSNVKFPEAQVQADVAFYADPAIVTNYVTIWTSKDGTEFTQNSAKLLEEATDLGQGWFLCKVINFAAIPEGTQYIKLQLETPGQGWDVQLYSTAMYQIPAGDINLVPPAIDLGEQAYPQQAAKDTVIQVYEATATDDTTPAGDLTVNYTVTSPVDSLVTVTDGQFVLGMYGDYTINYVCMDQNGNMATLSKTISAVDKAELPQTQTGALPIWAIVFIVVAVVIVAAVVVFILVRSREKSKK